MRVSILIGGAGKSTWAKKSGGVVCSADDFFLSGDGEYIFDFKYLGQAHYECRKKFSDALKNKEEHIVVDNTNLDIADMTFYLHAAESEGYEVTFRLFLTSIGSHLMEARHGVPDFKLLQQLSRLDALVANWPPRWPVPRVTYR